MSCRNRKDVNEMLQSGNIGDSANKFLFLANLVTTGQAKHSFRNFRSCSFRKCTKIFGPSPELVAVSCCNRKNIGKLLQSGNIETLQTIPLLSLTRSRQDKPSTVLESPEAIFSENDKKSLGHPRSLVMWPNEIGRIWKKYCNLSTYTIPRFLLTTSRHHTPSTVLECLEDIFLEFTR